MTNIRQMTEILARVPTPLQVRDKISSAKYLASDLFPPGGMWRSMFYLDALHQHLKDLARLGVADEAFVRHGVTVLIHALSDDSRPGQHDVCLRAMRVLTAFLQEKPTVMEPTSLIDNPAQFCSCLFRIINEAISLPPEHTGIRHTITRDAFLLLQEASRRQPTIWHSFTEDPGVVHLHTRILFDSDVELSTSAAEMIKEFCVDPSTSSDIVDFYMNTTLTVLPEALRHSGRAKHYFELTTKLLLINSVLRTDASRARTITDRLLSIFWSYDHIETADLPVLDVVMAGLIDLISESVKVLRSFKKPVELSGLAAKLFGKFLFVDGIGGGAASSDGSSHEDVENKSSHQLFHKQSRGAMYELVKAVCDTKDDFNELLQAMSKPLQAAGDDPNDKYMGHKEHLRPPTQFAGLFNLGQTCYMNSLLQQLYANVPFRQFILNTPTDPERQKLLWQVQNLFAMMQNSGRPAVDTTAVARELSTDVNSQEDVHSFYAELLSRLENELPAEARTAFQNFYTGRLITQVKGDCGHVSPKTEPFVDLPIVVKNKNNLAETLDELVQGEPMQGTNQYKCQACDPDGEGKLVDAMRRSCPDVTPDNLTFCLKRFEYDAFQNADATKVNDRFEFPETIDMSRYHHTYLDHPDADIDRDIFELVGVIVHMGTMGYGHYWSYTLLRDVSVPETNTCSWVRLEDRNVTTCQAGFAQVQHDCFGGLKFGNGQDRTDNAYVLFYQRKSAGEAHSITPASSMVYEPETQALLPPRVPMPKDMADDIRKENEWLHRVAHLFDDDLCGLLEWVLAQCKRLGYITHTSTADSLDLPADVSSDNEKEEAADEEVVERRDSDGAHNDEFAILLSRVATTFIQRIAPCDPMPLKKLRMITNGLVALFADQPKLASCVLRDFTSTNWFRLIIGHNNERVRDTIEIFVWHCLGVAREHDPAAYGEVMGQFRLLHASYLGMPTRIADLDWNAYLSFASYMASLSPADTAAVLDQGYWSWVFEMLDLPWDQATQDKYPGLVDKLSVNPRKMSALYEFVIELLEHHLALPAQDVFSPENGLHVIIGGKALLKKSEFILFGRKAYVDGVFSWIRTARFADSNGGNWRDFAPGKLLGILISRSGLSSSLQIILLQHINAEEEQFGSVLNLALHFCLAVESEERAVAIFTAVTRIAPSWEGCEGELVQIIPSAFEAMPRVVLITLESWALHFLLLKARMVRRPMAEFVKKCVFGADADLTEPDLVAVRARLAAKLTRDGASVLRRAFHEEQPRNRYESLIEVYQLVIPYLESLRQRVGEQLQAFGGGNVTQELRVEYDRAQQTLGALENLGAMVGAWGADTTVSHYLPADVVRSTEDESEDYESEDVDAEWDSSSEFA